MCNKPKLKIAELGRLTYDANTLARLLGVSKRHVRRMDSTGKMPRPIRLGRRKLWVAADIEAWLKAGAPPRERRKATRGGLRVSLCP